jgi:hypothetical protein
MKHLTQKQKNQAFAEFLKDPGEKRADKKPDLKKELSKIFAAAAKAWSN